MVLTVSVKPCSKQNKMCKPRGERVELNGLKKKIPAFWKCLHVEHHAVNSHLEVNGDSTVILM